MNVLAVVCNLAGFRGLQLGVFLSFKHSGTNEALGAGLSGAFLTSRLAPAWVYHSRLSVIQWIAIGLLTMGLLLLAGGKSAEV